MIEELSAKFQSNFADISERSQQTVKQVLNKRRYQLLFGNTLLTINSVINALWVVKGLKWKRGVFHQY